MPVRHQTSRRARTSITARQSTAAANRAANLRSTISRCRQHIAHVTSVVAAIRETRAQVQSQRRHALRDQLARAANRRTLLRQARTIAAASAAVGAVAGDSPGKDCVGGVEQQGEWQKKKEAEEEQEQVCDEKEGTKMKYSRDDTNNVEVDDDGNSGNKSASPVSVVIAARHMEESEHDQHDDDDHQEHNRTHEHGQQHDDHPCPPKRLAFDDDDVDDDDDDTTMSTVSSSGPVSSARTSVETSASSSSSPSSSSSRHTQQQQQAAAAMVAAHVLMSRGRLLLTSAGLLGPTLHGASFDLVADRILSPTAIHGARHVLQAARLVELSNRIRGADTVVPTRSRSTISQNRMQVDRKVNNQQEEQKQQQKKQQQKQQRSAVRPVHARDCRMFLSAILMGLHPSVTRTPTPSSSSSSASKNDKDNDDIVVQARVLLFLLSGGGHMTTTTNTAISGHNITTQSPLFDNNTQAVARQCAAWARAFHAWKERDVKTLTDPLIAEAVALDEQLATVIQPLVTANADVSSMQRRLLHGDDVAITNQYYNNTRGSDSENADMVDTPEGATELALSQAERAVAERQRELRDVIRRVGGQRAVQRLEAARRNRARDADTQTMHDLVVDPESVVTRLTIVTPPQETWDHLRRELLAGFETNASSSSPTSPSPGGENNPRLQPCLATRLAFLSRALNAMRPGCFTVPVPAPPPSSSSPGSTPPAAQRRLSTIAYARAVVDRVYTACHSCQAAVHDGALLSWRDDARRQVNVLASACTSATEEEELQNQQLASAITDIVRRATVLVLQAHTDVVRVRVLTVATSVLQQQQQQHAMNDNDTQPVPTGGRGDAVVDMERQLFVRRVQQGLFHADFPNTVQWLRDARSAATSTRRRREDAANVSDGVDAMDVDTETNVHQVVAQGLWTLITRDDGAKCARDNVPEVAWLDADRLAWLQNEVQVCAVVVGLGQLARRLVRSRGVVPASSTTTPSHQRPQAFRSAGDREDEDEEDIELQLERLCCDTTSRGSNSPTSTEKNGQQQEHEPSLLAALQRCVVDWVNDQVGRHGQEPLGRDDVAAAHAMVTRVGGGNDAVYDVVMRRIGDAVLTAPSPSSSVSATHAADSNAFDGRQGGPTAEGRSGRGRQHPQQQRGNLIGCDRMLSKVQARVDAVRSVMWRVEAHMVTVHDTTMRRVLH